MIYHYWYTAWPDHNLPEQPDSLIKLIKQVENMNKFDENSSMMLVDNDNNNINMTNTNNINNDNDENNNDRYHYHQYKDTTTSNRGVGMSSGSNGSSKKGGPILVHCSAGVGRTGCFLALSIGIRQLDAESLVDVVQIVCGLRRDR